MRVRDLSIPTTHLEDLLLPQLRNRVFHVTTPEGLAGIWATGAILPNSGELPYSFPRSAPPYFGSVGCVCVCDLRGLSDEEVRRGLNSYYFLNPRHQDQVVFAFLAKPALGALLLNKHVDPTQVGPKLLVPSVEAGHRGPIEIDALSEVWLVRVG